MECITGGIRSISAMLHLYSSAKANLLHKTYVELTLKYIPLANEGTIKLQGC